MKWQRWTRVTVTYSGTAMDEGRLDEPDNCSSLSSSSSSSAPLVDVCGMGHIPDIKDMSLPVVVVSTVVSIQPSLEFNWKDLNMCVMSCTHEIHLDSYKNNIKIVLLPFSSFSLFFCFGPHDSMGGFLFNFGFPYYHPVQCLWNNFCTFRAHLMLHWGFSVENKNKVKTITKLCEWKVKVTKLYSVYGEVDLLC